MWYAKMYFSGEKEFFENDAFGMQGVPSKQLELPFLESLLTFLELDEKEITPMLERISVNWERFVESRDREAYTAAMVELGMLAEKHIYLRLLYTRCYSCSSRRDLGKAPLQAITLDLKEFAKQFSETRKQVEKFWNVCWTWIPPGVNRRNRRRKTIITTSREIRSCSDLSQSR